MDTIVSKLSEIEGAAAAIVEHAEAQKDILKEEMQARTMQFDAQSDADTKKKLAAISDKLEAAKSSNLRQLEKESEEMTAALNKEYETHHEEYAKLIVKHITEV